jgi:glycosyltransferase involved in cell wall biosynthesis
VPIGSRLERRNAQRSGFEREQMMTSFSFLSTYPPTRCGLATFTESLAAAVTGRGTDSARIVRVIDELDRPAPSVVGSRTTIVGELRVGDPASLPAAARTLSASDVVVVQHEYGIYGGQDGEDVLEVLDALTAPCIVVLHTVLEHPTDHQRWVLEQVAARAQSVVVMTETARTMLAAGYNVDLSNVSVIAHGVPTWNAVDDATRSDRHTMLTWGLIGPGKGLEWGIRALAELRDVTPPVHYEILGETHPKVVAHEGEAYREGLQALAAELGVSDRVHFVNEYLDRDGIAAHVAAADLVLLPYDSRTQITSGVLVEAVGAGKHVIATGFPHSIELLGTEAGAPALGTIVAHESPEAIADAVRVYVALESAAATASAPALAVATGTAEPDNAWQAIADRYRMLADATRSADALRTA